MAWRIGPSIEKNNIPGCSRGIDIPKPFKNNRHFLIKSSNYPAHEKKNRHQDEFLIIELMFLLLNADEGHNEKASNTINAFALEKPSERMERKTTGHDSKIE